MKPFRNIVLAACSCVIVAGCAGEPPAPAGRAFTTADAQRGRLLYGAQCNACHTTQAHWRDKRIVQSWEGLVVQVTRWQGTARLDWSQEEIHDVAAYLNGTFYRLACPVAGCQGRAAQAGL